MNSQICKILEIMEDIKEDIKDNLFKIIMDSLMKLNNEKVVTTIKTSDEIPKLMTKIILKMIIDTYFEYTDNENDVVWIETIHRFVAHKLCKYNLELNNDIKHQILEIIAENQLIIFNDFVKKIKAR